MKIYLNIIGFSFLRFFSYPFEILATVLKRIVEMFFLILFWSFVTQSQSELVKISSYFFISMGVSELVMAKWGPLGSLIGNMAKSGQLNNYITKPISLIPTLYSLTLGRNGLRMTLGIFYVVIGIILNPPNNFIAGFLFMVYLIFSWGISLSYNLFEGILGIYLVESGHIKNALYHITRILNGSLIPLYFLPSPWKEVITSMPFAYIVYMPTNALAYTSFTQKTIIEIGIGIFWSIVIFLVVHYFWKRAMKNYEAIGI